MIWKCDKCNILYTTSRSLFLQKAWQSFDYIQQFWLFIFQLLLHYVYIKICVAKISECRLNLQSHSPNLPVAEFILVQSTKNYLGALLDQPFCITDFKKICFCGCGTYFLINTCIKTKTVITCLWRCLLMISTTVLE